MKIDSVISVEAKFHFQNILYSGRSLVLRSKKQRNRLMLIVVKIEVDKHHDNDDDEWFFYIFHLFIWLFTPFYKRLGSCPRT